MGTNPGQTDEYIEIANLGGGPQVMTGWTVRAPDRMRIAHFQDGFVMNRGRVCRVYTGTPRENACGTTAFNSTEVWPDFAGRAVLYYDALDLPGAETRYISHPALQPQPPNLVGVVE